MAQKRLQIIGPPLDGGWTDYFDFDRSTTLPLSPDLLLFSTGYHSHLGELSGDCLHLKDFHQGCVYTKHPNLFLIGFARPIIGNIPSISEMQARYAVGVLAGKYRLPADWQENQEQAWEALCAEYPAINTSNVYPAEHFTYCDALAREMGMMPTLAATRSLRTWLKIMLTPISTLHYLDEYFDRPSLDRQKVYMPGVLLAFLALMRLLGLPLRFIQTVRAARRAT